MVLINRNFVNKFILSIIILYLSLINWDIVTCVENDPIGDINKAATDTEILGQNQMGNVATNINEDKREERSELSSTYLDNEIDYEKDFQDEFTDDEIGSSDVAEIQSYQDEKDTDDKSKFDQIIAQDKKLTTNSESSKIEKTDKEDNVEQRKDSSKDQKEKIDESEQISDSDISIVPDITLDEEKIVIDNKQDLQKSKEKETLKEEYKKASDSLKDDVQGNTVGHVTPTSFDALLNIITPYKSFSNVPNQRPVTEQFGRKPSEEVNIVQGEKSEKYFPTPACDSIIDRFSWKDNHSLTQSAFKVIFGEIQILKKLTNIQAEKTILGALDVLKDPATEGVTPQEALALYLCEVDTLNGRTLYQKMIEFGYLTALLHPISSKVWSCVKYGHYYDLMGNNPLHLAAMSGSLQVVDYILRLIKNPVQVKMALEETNIYGQKPIDVAVEYRKPSIIKRIKSTYRTMANYVKTLNPEEILKNKKQEELLTEESALFCKPILPINVEEEEAKELLFMTEELTKNKVDEHMKTHLSNPVVQKHLREQKDLYNKQKMERVQGQKKLEMDRKQQELNYDTASIETTEESIDQTDSDKEDTDIDNEIRNNEENLVEDQIIENNDKIEQSSEIIEENTNNYNQEEKPRSILEKVLIWAIIIFCAIFTVTLALIWFAVKT